MQKSFFELRFKNIDPWENGRDVVLIVSYGQFHVVHTYLLGL